MHLDAALAAALLWTLCCKTSAHERSSSHASNSKRRMECCTHAPAGAVPSNERAADRKSGIDADTSRCPPGDRERLPALSSLRKASTAKSARYSAPTPAISSNMD